MPLGSRVGEARRCAMTRTFIYVSCGEGREIDVFFLDSQSGELAPRQRLITEGMPARNAGANFSSIPQIGKLKALIWTRTPGIAV